MTMSLRPSPSMSNQGDGVRFAEHDAVAVLARFGGPMISVCGRPVRAGTVLFVPGQPKSWAAKAGDDIVIAVAVHVVGCISAPP